ncbi:molecular chaperone DnaJ [Candidatus Saccharibacteria bacterium]|nr:molecular chaperone DnaJ [Candidatus Saccharibacteria bacterium]MCB9821001.1 molecular chaperone DnaJ [Candidatus Nomurabacteria bacterium]
MSKRDYYEVLGIDKSASADEIKKAYRRLAVKYHPDQGGDEEKFREINEANEVLSNPDKKQRYDQFGHAGVGGGAAGGGFNGFGGQEFHFDFGEGGLGDIFGSFFGGGMGGARSAQPERGRDVEVAIELSFEEAVFGTEKKISLNLEGVCEHCKGKRAEPGHELKKCDTCNGSGQEIRVMRTVFGNMQQATVCSKCHGEGEIPEQNCSVCGGKGTQRKEKEVILKVPAGIDDGAIIRLREHGEATSKGAAGDLFVNVRVKPHKRFTREGDLILSEEKIGMVEAALGTEIEVETVDGPIKMKVPAGTQSGTDFKLSGHGVPHIRSESRGPHIVTVVVETPTKLSKKQKDLLEEFSGSKKRWL